MNNNDLKEFTKTAFNELYEAMMWSLLNEDYMFPDYVDNPSLSSEERELRKESRYLIMDMAEQGIKKSDIDAMDRLYVMYVFLDKMAMYNPSFAISAYPEVRKRIGNRHLMHDKNKGTSSVDYTTWHKLFITGRVIASKFYPGLLPMGDMVNHGENGIIESGTLLKSMSKSNRKRGRYKKVKKSKSSSVINDNNIGSITDLFVSYLRDVKGLVISK